MKQNIALFSNLFPLQKSIDLECHPPQGGKDNGPNGQIEVVECEEEVCAGRGGPSLEGPLRRL